MVEQIKDREPLNDEQAEAEFERVKRVGEEWIKRLDLDHDVSFKWLLQRGNPGRREHTGDNQVILCEIATEWHHRTALIWVFVDMTAQVSDGDLEETVVHELSHRLVCWMRPDEQTSDSYAKEERAANQVTRAILRTWNAGCDQGRAELPGVAKHRDTTERKESVAGWMDFTGTSSPVMWGSDKPAWYSAMRLLGVDPDPVTSIRFNVAYPPLVSGGTTKTEITIESAKREAFKPWGWKASEAPATPTEKDNPANSDTRSEKLRALDRQIRKASKERKAIGDEIGKRNRWIKNNQAAALEADRNATGDARRHYATIGYLSKQRNSLRAQYRQWDETINRMKAEREAQEIREGFQIDRAVNNVPDPTAIVATGAEKRHAAPEPEATRKRAATRESIEALQARRSALRARREATTQQILNGELSVAMLERQRKEAASVVKGLHESRREIDQEYEATARQIDALGEALH